MPLQETREIIQKPQTVFDDIDAIIMAPPGWLVRSGLSLFALFLAIVLSLSWYIQYPEITSVAAIVTPERAPLAVVSPQSGMIQQVFGANYQQVKRGDILFYVGDEADLAEIQTASIWCLDQTTDTPVPSLKNLGKLGTAWLEVCAAHQNLLTFQAQARPHRAIRQVEKQVALTQKLENADKVQSVMGADELGLVANEYERNRKLYTDGVISLKEMEAAMQTLQSAKRQHEATKMKSTETSLRLNQLRYEQQKLSTDYERRVSELTLVLREKANAFLVAKDAWEQLHLVRAPTDGVLSSLVEMREATVVQKDQALLWLVPVQDTAMQLIATCQVPQTGMSDLQIGNEVRLSIDAYPEEEYGHLIGEVHHIGSVAVQNKEGGLFQEVIVKISHNNRTISDKALSYRPNLSARAELFSQAQIARTHVVSRDKCLGKTNKINSTSTPNMFMYEDCRTNPSP